jgi:surface antigen
VSSRLGVAAFVVGWLSLVLLVAVPGSSGRTGAVSPTQNALPNEGVKGVQYLCLSADYSCTDGGYSASAAEASGWPWQRYGGSNASSNAAGPHNCTLYAAFRLAKKGVAYPGWYDNATGWATKAAANGSTVDQTPEVGAIAQWSRDPGHVAYVESVTSASITITGDNNFTKDRVVGGVNLKGGYTEKIVIQSTSPAWPDNFIHFSTESTAPTTGDRGTLTAVLRPSDGEINDALWSRDGTRLAVTTTLGSKFILTVLTMHRTSINPGGYFEPLWWSPDNRRIGGVVTPTPQKVGQPGLVTAIEDLDTHITRVVAPGMGTISPNGRWVLYTKVLFGVKGQFPLVLKDLSTGKLTRALPSSVGEPLRNPGAGTWLADSSAVLCFNNYVGYLRSIGSTTLIKLPTANAVAMSPDGTRVALQVGRGGGVGDPKSKIIVQGLRSKFAAFTIQGSAPVWSADGTLLAYASPQAGENIIVMNVLTRKTHEVSTLPNGQSGTGLSWPISFSPDGKRLAFASVSNNFPGGDGKRGLLYIKTLTTTQ